MGFTDYKKQSPMYQVKEDTVRFEYGFGCHVGNGEPYFSLTGQVWFGGPGYLRGRAREPDSFGTQHAVLDPEQPTLSGKAGGLTDNAALEEWKALREARDWHLFGLVKGPMHYVANAEFWAEHATGIREFGPYDNVKGDPKEEGKRRFANHALIGKLDTDTAPEEYIRLHVEGHLQKALEIRLPVLRKAFYEKVVVPLRLQNELVRALQFFNLSIVEWRKSALMDDGKEAPTAP